MVERKRRRKTRMSFPHRRLEATEKEMSGARLTGRCRTGQPEAVLLPRPRLYSRVGWSHVELHVLDLPITQAADQVVGFSPCDLPITLKDKYQSWDVSEGMPLAGPPLGDVFRTSHPRLYSVHLPPLPPTSGVSPK